MGQPAKIVREKEEEKQTMIKMPSKLYKCLLTKENLPNLLTKAGLLHASLNEEKNVVLRAESGKALSKALGTLRRVAYHCQWGVSPAKVSALLAAKPERPITTVVARLTATSGRLQSHESRLTNKVRKLRIGSAPVEKKDPSAHQCEVSGVPGMSRKHCTITFEPDKGAVYVQDLSTNGTYLNGKKLPRPPYKNPQDARVRLFHGDELYFRLRSEDAEELGYVVNLVELS